MPLFLLHIASRSVRKNWRHSVGSMLAVAVGFTAIALFAGYLTDVGRTVGTMMAERLMMGTLFIEKSGASEAITEATPDPAMLGEPEQAFIDAYLRDHASEVVGRVRSLFIAGYASNGRASAPFGGWGYDPVEGAAVRRRFAWDAYYGKPLHLVGPDSMQLGRRLGALLDCGPTTRERVTGPDGLVIAKERPFECRRRRIQLMTSTASGQVNAVDAAVASLIDGGAAEVDAKLVAMPLELAQQLLNTREVSHYSVVLRDPSVAARFSRDVVAAAKARGLSLDATPWQQHDMGALYRQAMQLLGAFRGLMAIVVVTIVGMAVLTTMAKAVSERTREIGTLRSLGFLRQHVTRLFVVEAALLSASACAVGLVATLAITVALNAAGVTYNAGINSEPIPLRIAIDPPVWLAAAAFLMAVAILAAWLPARRAARRRIPDALAWA